MATSNNGLWGGFGIDAASNLENEWLRERIDYEKARILREKEKYERDHYIYDPLRHDKTFLPGMQAAQLQAATAKMLEEHARREARTVNTKTIKQPMLVSPLSAVVNLWRMRFEDWMRESDIEGLDAEWALAYARLKANNKFEVLGSFFRLKEDA